MSPSLYEAIQEERAKYPPESRSAVLPALRLAQDEYGWLSPDVLREVADALELTPAYCHSIASFYNQFHLAPIGEHLVEVCTNVSCAVVGAQQVVEAFEEVGEALDLTPAYCKAVASFYDMFHLEPVGRHVVEICTNVSCALVGAQQVVETYEEELGIRPGETSEDGLMTLRTIECAGGCGTAVVVSVDGRYVEPVQPNDVPGIVEGVRSGD